MFNTTHWYLAILKWSDKWPDKKTDIPGSAFYFIPTSENYEDEESGQELVVFHEKKEEDDGDRHFLRFDGGKAVYEKLPPKAYINIDPSYTGSRLMTIEQFEKKITKMKTAKTTTSKRATA